ncbi:hypothetical protein [Limosilactobacillus oris]|uniref:hypothetical protein n=1 Tax=Limosilactobacillus oris TaxID=1632 RepID=UPI002657D42D|nr:hypothetical protein [Limosilactobacillus oris]
MIVDEIVLGTKDNNGDFRKLNFEHFDKSIIDKPAMIQCTSGNHAISFYINKNMKDRINYLKSATRFKSVHEHKLEPPKLSKWGN